MDYATDLSPIRWLNLQAPVRPAGEPLRLKHLLPESYHGYWALLPTVGILEAFPFEQVNPDSPDVGQINHNVAIWNQVGVYQWGNSPTYQRTSFRQLSAQFALPYDVSLVRKLPWGKRGFATLDEPTAAGLLVLLRELAPEASLNLYVEDYWRWGPQLNQLLPTDEDVVYRVSPEEFVSFLQGARFDASAYLFPDDQSWCLVTVEDGLCPFIGVSEKAEAVIQAHFDGEKMPLDPEATVF